MTLLLWLAASILLLGLLILYTLIIMLLKDLKIITRGVLEMHEHINNIDGQINNLEKSMDTYKTYKL